MKGSKTAMLLLLSLPLLAYGFSGRNFHQISQEMPNRLQNISCEHYDRGCFEKAYEKGIDATNCTGIQKCPRGWCTRFKTKHKAGHYVERKLQF